ncbi:MAG: hypothetical protein KatS3mg102_0006 [Planctomycetota bacterium]|nr:MAG: hypothetical protein KatS3mg102_0006 [Planctomycetota bacterium]
MCPQRLGLRGVVRTRLFCPSCRRAFTAELEGPREQRRWVPFCSERCRLLDLSRWLDEEYRIRTPLEPRAHPGTGCAEAGD